MGQTVYLVLENGVCLEGQGFGAALPQGQLTGEVVFTTGMTGYLETITDPSYYGQIVVQTFPLIGNYGVIPSDFESEQPKLTAYIVKEWCQAPSNFRSEGDLDTFFKACHIPAVSGIDTRYLTQVLREEGTMNGYLSYEKPTPERIRALAGYHIDHAVDHAATRQRQHYSVPDARFHVALWDFGAKYNIVRELMNRGCSVTVLPPQTSAEDIAALHPDGLMLSNGPGDPADNTGIIRELQKLCARPRLPIFGICLGHQLLALAHGAKTMKLPYGHRGANQPVKELETGRVFMTSQNHGYAVDQSTLPAEAGEIFINVNDGSCEGVAYTDHPAFSVQFHPEACGGPLDTRFLFDRFLKQMEESKHAEK